MDAENTQPIEQVTLRVKDQAGEELFFKVKPTTRMQKVFESYAQRRGVSLDALRFMVDGEKIHENDSPKTLELEDNDQIDVMLETVGGTLKEWDQSAPSNTDSEQVLTLKVREQTGEEMVFKVKKHTSMKKIMAAFADKKGVSLNHLTFMFDGNRITEEDTPKMLEMEDGDQLEVVLHQTGGDL